MFTVELRHFYTQLERVLVELRDGHPVTITHQGLALYDFVPALGSDDNRAAIFDSVMQHNRSLGWPSRGGQLSAFRYGDVVALMRLQTRCTRLKRWIILFDDLLQSPLDHSWTWIRLIEQRSRDERSELLLGYAEAPA